MSASTHAGAWRPRFVLEVLAIAVASAAAASAAAAPAVAAGASSTSGSAISAAAPGNEATDAPPLVLEHLTTADGLPEGEVLATLQDSQGFIWFGTADGLVRYDGQELVRYAYSRGERRGLPGNFVYRIVEDERHDLWIAIKGGGVARWNRSRDDFTVYRHDPHDPRSLSSDAVRALSIDSRGRIWIGTIDAGLDVLDPVSGQVEHFRHDASRPGSLASDDVFTLAWDRVGNLWIGTSDGLDELEPGASTFRHFRHTAGDPHSLTGREITQVLEDPSGSLWVGSFDGGLDRMDRSGKVVQVFRHDPRRAGSLASDDVRALLADRAGNLWVGTAAGLDRLDRATGEIVHYKHEANDPESLRDSFVLSLYQDENGLVWIGTFTGGASRWDPRSSELGAHRPAWLGRFTTAFADAPDGRVWVSSMGGGLAQYDPSTGRAQGLATLLGRRVALDNGRVMSLLSDRRGALWIGTMGAGLYELDAHHRLKSFPVKAGDPRALSAPGIVTIHEARDGELWIGTFGGGVDVLDPATGLIRQLPYGAAPGAVSSANVIAMAEDSRGRLWIGTDGGGLDVVRPDGTLIRVFRHVPGDPGSLPANTIYALAVDSRDRVWIGTADAGLAVASAAAAPETMRFRTYSREEGLSSDAINGILVDERGRVWMSGNAGLMRLDPDDGAIKTFHLEDGLQGEEFTTGAAARLRDGRFCFGGPRGFNLFYPFRVTESRKPPRLALTGVEILGAPAPGPLPYWLRSRISLGYRDNIVSLDVSVLDFTSPKHNRLAYRMAGLTDRWIDLGAQHRITLTNLGAGDHVLEVRGASSDSIWSEPLRITLHRSPAPWASGWAFALYALAALALLAHRLRKHRRQRLLEYRERERLEAEVAARTQALTESNRQLAEAARAKSDFLDRMSHELRTPMNGVVGMTELLARTPLSAVQSHLTETIRSSAQVLLRIVNDLLDLSRAQAGKVALEVLPLDLARMLEECTSVFAATVQSKGIELIARPLSGAATHGGQALLGDPLRVRQILMNLIGNAIKFTERGRVVVEATVEPVAKDGAQLQLSVCDTGIGMDAETMEKIFDPFTQADESTSRRFGGSGLGLAICRELAELMGGRITVQSAPGKGSTFRVLLPLALGTAHSNGAPVQAERKEAAPGEGTPATVSIGGRVLLVEDEPVNAAVAQGYLETLGCQCIWTRHGAEAVARSSTERFDLILMDLNLPGLDGFATTQLIRDGTRGGARTPVIALTAHDAARVRDRCLAAGMDDVLTKPYTLEACGELLRRWIRRDDAAAGEVEHFDGASQAVGPPTSGLQRVGPSGAADATELLSRVDADVVARLRAARAPGRADLYGKLVDLFRAGSAGALAALGAALDLGDLPSARAICHKLKSSAANVGAGVFSQHVRRLEQRCAAGDPAGAREIYERLKLSHPALVAELESLRLEEIA
ncbi:MAG TPA: two-component regulator propeller domain-containing protein [Steroidobacteraceae bacterium]|nr:two-component regulator propeller domain-containing protein [Steroidobacteraceae bacterium]